MRSKHNLYVYTSFFEFLDSFFFEFPVCKGGIPTFIILCVFRHFRHSTSHTFIILLFFVFPAVF